MEKLKTFLAFTFLALCLSAAAAHSITPGLKVKCAPKDLPAAITAAFNTDYPSLKIATAYRRIRNNVVTYKISFSDKKTKRYITYSPDGKKLKIEEVIDPKTLPAPVLQTISTKYPDGKIKRAEKALVGNKVTYEIAIRYGSRKNGIVIATENSGSPDERIILDDNGLLQPRP